MFIGDNNSNTVLNNGSRDPDHWGESEAMGMGMAMVMVMGTGMGMVMGTGMVMVMVMEIAMMMVIGMAMEMVPGALVYLTDEIRIDRDEFIHRHANILQHDVGDETRVR